MNGSKPVALPIPIRLEIIFTAEALAEIKASGNSVGHHEDSDVLSMDLMSTQVTVAQGVVNIDCETATYIYPMHRIARIKVTERCLQQPS